MRSARAVCGEQRAALRDEVPQRHDGEGPVARAQEEVTRAQRALKVGQVAAHRLEPLECDWILRVPWPLLRTQLGRRQPRYHNQVRILWAAGLGHEEKLGQQRHLGLVLAQAGVGRFARYLNTW